MPNKSYNYNYITATRNAEGIEVKAIQRNDVQKGVGNAENSGGMEEQHGEGNGDEASHQSTKYQVKGSSECKRNMECINICISACTLWNTIIKLSKTFSDVSNLQVKCEYSLAEWEV